ncbi:MAG: S8 family serine peptidase [Oscillochloridaceae bacterium umkhey_bin13]
MSKTMLVSSTLFLVLTLLLAVPSAAALPATSPPVLRSLSTPAPTKPSPVTPAADPTQPALYIVHLTEPALSERNGTLPRTQDRLDPAFQAQSDQLDQGQQAMLRTISAQLGTAIQPLHQYRYALNGFALALTPDQAAKVAALSGVRAVEPNTILQRHSDVGPHFLGAAQPNAAPRLFAASLDGGQEVPPVTTNASGEALLVFEADSGRLDYRVTFADLSGPLTMAHLHLAPSGSNGPVVVDLFPGLIGSPAPEGVLIGTTSLTNEQAEALTAGNLYVNLHTSAHPGGEIRGQLIPIRGQGVIIGILDSGINVDHPSFQASGADGSTQINPLGPNVYLGVCDPAHPDYAETFRCNAKLVGAYTYPETSATGDPNGRPSPRDDDGHGSHIAATAAGAVVDGAAIGGIALNRVSGVAPQASLVVYDVCGTLLTSGCPLDAVLAALDQAVADGVDVINLSWGGGAADPWNNSLSLSLLATFGAGIANAVSAGNDGPDPATISGPANAPWALSVAASSHNRAYANSLANFSGGEANTRPNAPLVGKGFAPGAVTAPIIYAGDPAIGNPLCTEFSTAQAALVAGKIVVCERGLIGRATKSFNVAFAGGIGFVLINNAFFGTDLVGDFYPFPSVHLTFADGEQLKAWLNGCRTCQARITGVARTLDSTLADQVAGFSSRGPSPSTPNTLLPSLSAPGLDILAATADFLPTPEFEFLSGTSMAAPHVAGGLALLRQIHPEWSPSELVSALMTTAQPVFEPGSEVVASPFVGGAGRLDLVRAAAAGLVLDEQPAAFGAANPNRGGDPATLNLPALVNAACVANCSFTRTVHNPLQVSTSWLTTVQADPGLTLQIDPASFTLEPGASQSILITVTASPELTSTYQFAAVSFTNLDQIAPEARLPVAVQTLSSDLPFELDLITSQAEDSTTRLVRTRDVAQLDLTSYGLVRATPQTERLPPDPTPGNLRDPERGGILIQTLTLPQRTTRAHVSLDRSSAPDLDLYLFMDDNGDGLPSEDEIVCANLSLSADERCELYATDLINGLPETLELTLLVQNYRGSGAALDQFTLYTAVLGTASDPSFSLNGPNQVSAGEPFALELAWKLSDDPRPGDRAIALIRMGEGAVPAETATTPLAQALVTIFYTGEQVFVPVVRR